MPDPATDRPTIALAAGGTGGHLFPAEALARELLARGFGVVLHTERRGAQYTAALEGLPHVVLPASSLEGGALAKARAALTIARGVLASRRDLKVRRAALLVGFGGYPSVAPALAARSLGLPLLLHEQATRLSKANARLLRFADALATSFPTVDGAEGFDPARIVQTGNPVRRAILASIFLSWYLSERSLSVSNITSRRAELFYWFAILFSNTLGTALGDYLADDSGLGSESLTHVSLLDEALAGGKLPPSRNNTHGESNITTRRSLTAGYWQENKNRRGGHRDGFVFSMVASGQGGEAGHARRVGTRRVPSWRRSGSAAGRRRGGR